MPTAEAEAKSKTRIALEHAAAAAKQYFQRIYPNIQLFSIEEVELTEDGKFWLITLGFEPTVSEKAQAAMAFSPIPKTKYKVFKVDARTGAVVSMKIRSLG